MTETAKEIVTETAGTMPAPMTLSDRDRELRHFTETAKDEPGRISVEDLNPAILMAIPEDVARPECSYKWAARDMMSQELSENGRMWQIVTRSNHGHVPARHFDLATGAILYNGQNVLVYTWKDNAEALKNKHRKEFDFKSKSLMKDLEKSYTTPGGKEVARLEITDDPGAGAGAHALDPSATYDFDED